MNNLYFTPIEVSRLIGMDKRGIYNKRAAGIIESCLSCRRGRRKVFIETLYPFEEVVKLCSDFEDDYKSRIFSMFQLQSGPYAFKVIEACRIAGVSHQWVQRLIKQGKIEKVSGIRKLKTAPEGLIRLGELKKLLNGRIGKIINIEEEILNLFRLVTE